MKLKFPNRFVLTLIASSATLTMEVSAATQYWDGSSTSANNTSDNTSTTATAWLNGGNWDNGTTSAAKASWTANDVAIFGGDTSGAVQTVTLSSGIALGSGSVIGSSTGLYKISITGTGFNQIGNPSGSFTINAGSTLSAEAASNNAHNIGTGGITLNGGTLTSANGPSGAANDGGYGNWLLRGTVTVGGSSVSTISSSTLFLNTGSGTFTVNDSVVGSGTDLLISSKILVGSLAMTKAGEGTMELTGANGYTGGTTINAGTIKLSGSGTVGGTVNIGAGGTLEIARQMSLGNTISGTGILKKSTVATLYLGGKANTTHAGVSYELNNSYVLLGNDNATGYTATFGSLEGNSTIVGPWNGSGVFVVEAGARNENKNYAGVIADKYPGDGSTQTVGFTKTGSATQTLSAANTYSGQTTVGSGTLSLGPTGSIANSKIIAVGEGAIFDVSSLPAGTFTLGGGKTLKGKGTVTGSVSVAPSGVGIVAGGDGVTGTLSITGDLTFEGVGDVNIGTLSSYTGVAAVAVAGQLSALGGSESIYVNLPVAAVEPGTYHLISHANELADPGAFVIGSQPLLSARQVGSLVNSAGFIDYVVSGSNPVWTGSLNSIWSTATMANPKNWNLSGGGATDYIEGDAVLFDDTATGTTTVDITADVSPVAIQFINSTKDYTLQGAGSGIVGNSQFSKSGTGSLTINCSNSYDGGSTLTDGTVILGSGTALGTGSVFLNGGALDIHGMNIANPIVLGGGSFVGGGILSGTLSGGSFTYNGAGNTLVLTGANSQTGATVVLAGDVRIGDGGLTGTLGGTGNITIHPGASITTNRSDTINLGRSVIGGGSLIQDGSGTLRTGQSGNDVDITVNHGSFEALDGGWSSSYFATANRLVTINSGATFITDTHTLGGLGAAYNRPDIVINQGGTWKLKHEQYFGAGDLVINGGSLVVEANDLRLYAGTAVIGASVTGSVVSGTGVTLHGDVAFDVADGTAAADLAISAGISQSGTHGLAKSGTGTMVLTGTSTYGGSTTVNSGTLKLTGSLTSNTTVKSTAELKGSGSTTGTLTVESGGTLSPGDSIGALHTGAASLAGTYVCEVDAATSDALVVSGGLNLTGATFSLSGTPVAASYTIATYTPGGLIGTFNAVPALPADYSLDYSTDGVIKLVKTAGFSSWIAKAEFGLAPADQEPGADPDGDGVNNLMEYAIAGRNPSSSDGSVGSFTSGLLSFTKRPEAAADPRITYQIQESDDLGLADTWTEVGSYTTNDGTTISFTLPAGRPKTFARLTVTQTP